MLIRFCKRIVNRFAAKQKSKEVIAMNNAKENTKNEAKTNKQKSSKNKASKQKKISCYTNRELSWLKFNERVLDEAGNPAVPLGERLSFASIYQSNLDEFFMVRVGTLMVQMDSKEKIRDNKTNMSGKQQVKAIWKDVRALEKKKAKVYEQLMGELEPQGIRIINFNRLSNNEGKLLEAYFDSHIAPFLSPMITGKPQPFPFLNNMELYAIVLLTTKNGKPKTGIVSCSNSVFNRLIEIPTRPGTFMLSEELILHFVSKLYTNYTIKEKSIIRLTRNADIDQTDVYDEELDYRDIMEQLIKQRVRLNPVRLEISREFNKDALKEIADYMGISVKHIIKVSTPLNLSFVSKLRDYLSEKQDKQSLFYAKRSPQPSPELNIRKSIIEQVEKKDVLLSYPFESIRPFIKLLNDAAVDESVVSIKMTLYRVADKSKIVDALVEAAENGKEVDVLIELRARFDEANNIEMSHKLEDAGCNIIYGLGDYKVHSKLCLITRKTKDGISYITQIGTGNYNEKTARLYTDLCLITANKSIGAESAAIFGALLKGETVTEANVLLAAPHCLQNRIIDMIDDEIKKANAGEAAYVGAKINSLTDKAIMKKLIEASCAGVKVDLIVRGICCLLPGIKDKTENIRVISIVGRFLEHSRIYRFGTAENDKIYISSADFMTRNTLKRVEIGVPVYDEKIKARIRHIFDTLLNDDEKGRELTPDGVYVNRNINYPKINSQELFYDEAYIAAKNKEETNF